jgi:hypothetical protein
MDPKRKRDFNKWRKQFRLEVARSASHTDEVLSSAALTTIAWNCAFLVVTD